MGYSREIYDIAEKKIQSLRLKALDEYEVRMFALYKKYPRIKQIKKQLSQTALYAAKAVLRGSDTKKELEKLKKENQILQAELANILLKGGYASDYDEVKFYCKKCNDTGYVNGIMCSCMKNALKQEAYNRVNRLSPLALSTFEDFSLEYYSDKPIRDGLPSAKEQMRRIYNSCKKYAENFSLKSQSLLMQGTTGLGKTHLSLAIANVVLNKNFGVIYASAPNIVSKLEKERFNHSRFTDDSEKYLIECDLFILDDLGTEFSTAYSSSAIYNILNSRISMSKPTIVSTNLSVKELEKVYSERLVSRIMGNHLRLQFFGSDIRQIAQRYQRNT